MNHEQYAEHGATGDLGEDEEVRRVRELLARDAYGLRPSPVPYAEVCRRGRALRQRRVVGVWAALTTLAVVPAGAYAVTDHLTDHGRDARTVASAAHDSSRSARPSGTASSSTPEPPEPTGPARPATAGQLLDGITYEQAATDLEKCVDAENEQAGRLGKPAASLSPGASRTGLSLPAADRLRIVLAMRSTGDSNTPGDGRFVVAVDQDATDPAQQTRIICTLKDGVPPGVNLSTGDASGPDAGPVVPDINAQKLYTQSVFDRGRWKLPFRWGDIGTVDPSVARVTVSYGGGTGEAVLDHGWFVASGLLRRQVTVAPHIKGYDDSGKLVYDSDRDKTYARELP